MVLPLKEGRRGNGDVRVLSKERQPPVSAHHRDREFSVIGGAAVTTRLLGTVTARLVGLSLGRDRSVGLSIARLFTMGTRERLSSRFHSFSDIHDDLGRARDRGGEPWMSLPCSSAAPFTVLT